VDGAYSAMIAAVQKNLAPNLLILHYSQNWTVRNLVLVPSVFLTESVVVQRAPLSAAARRSGWIGCNLALKNVPPDGKIHLVQNDAIIPSSNIREIYKKFQKLEAVDWKLRGWTFDVLRVARKLAKTEFSLKEVYKFESELASLHPQNNNIKAKVRQQLQVLRDMGILEFLQPGRYCFKA
jgi:type II restriction enzyme